jgi:thymidylate kinase
MTLPKITVTGVTGSGKSTITNIIYNALLNEGFNVAVSDIDTTYPISDEVTKRSIPALKKKCAGQSIHIETIQTMRQSL